MRQRQERHLITPPHFFLQTGISMNYNKVYGWIDFDSITPAEISKDFAREFASQVMTGCPSPGDAAAGDDAAAAAAAAAAPTKAVSPAAAARFTC